MINPHRLRYVAIASSLVLALAHQPALSGSKNPDNDPEVVAREVIEAAGRGSVMHQCLLGVFLEMDSVPAIKQ